jgi:hypothetical protein
MARNEEPVSLLKPPVFTRFGLRTITLRDGVFVYDDGTPFNAVKYSRFKYGDTSVAEAYGWELATELERRLLIPFHAERTVITSSAYKLVATAARSVAQVMHDQLHARGYKVDAGRIHRANLTSGDYATMPAATRELVMRENGIYIDYDLFVRRHVVVVDDIRITGAHEASICEMFRDVPILSLTHVYVVQMDPNVAADPKVEDRLNRSWVEGLDQLTELIVDNPAYVFNARTVKMILGAPRSDLLTFLQRLTNDQLEQLYRGVVGDGYHTMSNYKDNFPCLRGEMERRNLISARDA